MTDMRLTEIKPEDVTVAMTNSYEIYVEYGGRLEPVTCLYGVDGAWRVNVQSGELYRLYIDCSGLMRRFYGSGNVPLSEKKTVKFSATTIQYHVRFENKKEANVIVVANCYTLPDGSKFYSQVLMTTVTGDNGTNLSYGAHEDPIDPREMVEHFFGKIATWRKVKDLG